MYYVARHFSLRAPATCPTMLQRLQPNETENVDCLQSNTFHVNQLDSSNTTCAIFRNRAALFTNALSYIKVTREKYSKFFFIDFLSSTLLRNVLGGYRETFESLTHSWASFCSFEFLYCEFLHSSKKVSNVRRNEWSYNVTQEVVSITEFFNLPMNDYLINYALMLHV